VRCALILCAALAGCSTPGQLSEPRQLYNDGLRALAGVDGEPPDYEAAQRDLTAARDQAGPDTELRFRSARALALAMAGEADGLAKDKPEEALAKLRGAAGWLNDAVRMRPDDQTARRDLEVLLRRAQAIADKLNQGQNGLAARLDRLIEDQRHLRDGVRQLMNRVEAAGAAAEPRAFQPDHDALATDERTLVGDAGTVLDLAGDEIGLIDGKPEDQRAPEEQARLVQLRNLEHWIGAARADLADARLALRRLQGDRAHRRADAGLGNLVRAREQLEDPVKVLQGLAEGEQMLLLHTAALAQLRAGKPLFGGDPAAPPPPQPAAPPPWLTPAHLGERQTQVQERATELVARLEAGVARGAQGADPAAGGDPRMTQILAQAGEAVPHAQAAVTAMGAAATALTGDRIDDASEREQEALRALVAAIERFADLRTLIELTWADQQRLLGLLDPANAEAKKLAAGDRQRQVGEAVAANVDRITRMKGLIATDLAGLAQQAGQPAQPGQPAPDPQQLEAEKARYAQAEELRAKAQVELDALAAIVAGRGPGAALERARNAHVHLEALRQLFFTLIQHLERLHTEQAQTHDRTATAQRADDDRKRAEQIGPLPDFQVRHADLAESLAAAIEAQADAAAQQGGGDPQAQEMAQRLQQAAPEVRAAATAIRNATGTLTTARDQSTSTSVDLEPTLEQQKQGLAHIEEALRILSPQQQPQDQDQQDQQQQQDQQVSQQEAERRLQEIREREAERQREQRERNQRPPEPVEKDW
jgi:Ca-activated chloride channel homolog